MQTTLAAVLPDWALFYKIETNFLKKEAQAVVDFWAILNNITF